jgi:hypothetical protein
MKGTKLEQRPLAGQMYHQEPPLPVAEHAREVTFAQGSANEDGTGVSGLGPPARQGTTHGGTQRPPLEWGGGCGGAY